MTTGSRNPDRHLDTLVVRAATVADAGAIAAFGARTFDDSFGRENTAEDMAAYLSKAFDVSAVEKDLGDPRVTYFVGEVDGRLCAYAMVRAGGAPPSVDGHAPLELVRFYVDRPWHGSGVARAMMAACEAESRRRGARTLWLGVWEKNPRAIRFYEKCGFRDVGSQVFVLGSDSQTDRVMARPIHAM